MRKLHAIGVSIIVLVFALVINSCESDEYMIEVPIKIGNDCDTTNVSFSKTVLPLLTDCVPCHNNSNKYAGINLDGYDKIKSVANSGKLVGSLKSSMSDYFSRKDCDYVKIQAWINQGTKNN